MVAPITGWILNRLKGFKKSGEGYVARCPAHDDAQPSLSVTEAADRVLLHCFTGCEPEAVCRALGISTAHLFFDHEPPGASVIPFPSPAQGKGAKARMQLPPPAAVYQYTDGFGNVLAEKGRFELPEIGSNGKPKKTFLWRPAGHDRWDGLDKYGLSTAALALWGAEAVREADPAVTVYYCEGEKAALACREHGLLAVTHGGGASTKDFGDALEVLRGRTVALWPDNDATGKEYMARVHARLLGLAAQVRIVNVPLPPTGDAVEYFAAGGTVEQLEGGEQPITGPSVELLGDDAVAIRHRTPLGDVTLTFQEMEKSARELNAELTLTIDSPSRGSYPYTLRINLLSESARTALRRELDNIYGKEWDWARLLNQSVAMAKDTYLNQDRSVDLYEIEDAESDEVFLIPDLVPLDAPTIFFGDGGSLKSYFIFSLVYCLAVGDPFLGRKLPQMPVLVVDYEDNERNFKRRMRRIAAGLGYRDFIPPGTIHYWSAKGIPLRDLAEAIRRKVVQEGIGIIVIDSVAPACGGKPEDADVALAFFRALAKIGVTSLLLAHVSKGAGPEQPKHPFGSVFWHNEARMTWYVERAQDEDSDELDIGLYCKKVNDGKRPHPLAIHASFEGQNGPLRLDMVGRMAAVPALQEKREPKYRIRDVLAASAPLTVKQLAAELDLHEGTVNSALRRTPKWFVKVGKAPPDKKGGKPQDTWGILTEEYSLNS